MGRVASSPSRRASLESLLSTLRARRASHSLPLRHPPTAPPLESTPCLRSLPLCPRPGHASAALANPHPPPTRFHGAPSALRDANPPHPSQLSIPRISTLLRVVCRRQRRGHRSFVSREVWSCQRWLGSHGESALFACISSSRAPLPPLCSRFHSRDAPLHACSPLGTSATNRSSIKLPLAASLIVDTSQCPASAFKHCVGGAHNAPSSNHRVLARRSPPRHRSPPRQQEFRDFLPRRASHTRAIGCIRRSGPTRTSVYARPPEASRSRGAIARFRLARPVKPPSLAAPGLWAPAAVSCDLHGHLSDVRCNPAPIRRGTNSTRGRRFHWHQDERTSSRRVEDFKLHLTLESRGSSRQHSSYAAGEPPRHGAPEAASSHAPGLFRACARTPWGTVTTTSRATKFEDRRRRRGRENTATAGGRTAAESSRPERLDARWQQFSTVLEVSGSCARRTASRLTFFVAQIPDINVSQIPTRPNVRTTRILLHGNDGAGKPRERDGAHGAVLTQTAGPAARVHLQTGPMAGHVLPILTTCALAPCRARSCHRQNPTAWLAASRTRDALASTGRNQLDTADTHLGVVVCRSICACE